DFVAARFGDQVADRFVDPLLGSLHAGDVRTLSLRACAPALVPTATAGTSLVARRRGRPTPRMSFVTWPEGLVRVVDRLAGELGADVRTGTAVRSLERRGGRWRLHLARTQGSAVHGSVAHGTRQSVDGSTIDVDGVVLAVSSAVAAPLLRDLVPAATELLAQTARADVATVLLALPRDRVADVRALTGTGVLVPSSVGSLLKAATFLSTKWAHLDLADTVLVRLSAGRAGDDRLAELDDDELVSRLREDLAIFTGVDATPDEVLVERWPAAMPQLTVGHTVRLASARTALTVHAPGVVLAGSSYDGIGLASCAASARQAADALLTHLQPSKDLA
ncbi:MAG: protoporphyrinogen oxidase, partial [Intrasporangiaceae bacterium]|nr:protoporphyrinogen oxidase [Intrasporangiaceae bacterium]